MPRTPRLINNDETTVYHVMSRSALDGFQLWVLGTGFGDVLSQVEKDV